MVLHLKFTAVETIDAAKPIRQTWSKLLVSLAKHYKSFEYVAGYIKARLHSQDIFVRNARRNFFYHFTRGQKSWHCGVTFKSIPWFYGGRTFVEIINQVFN